MIRDPILGGFADQLTVLLARLDEAIKSGDMDARIAVVRDIESVKNEIRAELARRNPPPEWTRFDKLPPQ